MTTRNYTKFADEYRWATDELMSAVASSNPCGHLADALGYANNAMRAAANIIESGIAQNLIQTITQAKPLILA